MATSRNFAKHCVDYVKGFMSSYKVLLQYLRNEAGEPYGVVVAFKIRPTDEVKMGHSVCNLEMGDTFHKYIGLYIAIQRALKGGHTSIHHAGELAKAYGFLKERSSKYFKVSVSPPSYLYGSSRVEIGKCTVGNQEAHIEDMNKPNEFKIRDAYRLETWEEVVEAIGNGYPRQYSAEPGFYVPLSQQDEKDGEV